MHHYLSLVTKYATNPNERHLLEYRRRLWTYLLWLANSHKALVLSVVSCSVLDVRVCVAVCPCRLSCADDGRIDGAQVQALEACWKMIPHRLLIATIVVLLLPVSVPTKGSTLPLLPLLRLPHFRAWAFDMKWEKDLGLPSPLNRRLNVVNVVSSSSCVLPQQIHE